MCMQKGLLLSCQIVVFGSLYLCVGCCLWGCRRTWECRQGRTGRVEGFVFELLSAADQQLHPHIKTPLKTSINKHHSFSSRTTHMSDLWYTIWNYLLSSLYIQLELQVSWPPIAFYHLLSSFLLWWVCFFCRILQSSMGSTSFNFPS